MTKAQQTEEKIRAYFAARRRMLCDKNAEPLLSEDGQVLYEFYRAPTVTGLAHALGFSTREQMLAVSDKKSAEAIASALLIIEEYAEEKLFSKESFSGTKLFLSVNFPRWRQAEAAEAEPFPEAYAPWAG